MSGWKKICCAVDFSEESRFALEEAAELSSRSGGDLTVIHVVGGGRRYGESSPRGEISSALVDHLARQVEEWRSSAERIATNRVCASTLEGTPADEILRFTRDGGYDLLVVGTPGVLGCERIVFGSVADSVIRRAPCSVLVARRRAEHPRP